MAYTPVKTHLPPGCGEDLDKSLLFNPYQQRFMKARRQRFCLNCKTVGEMDESCNFVCKKCATRHFNNLTAPRLFDRLLVLSGRGGGKTLIGAHAAREEMMVPGSIGWVMGPTYKILHDSTFPTLVRLIPPAWVKKWDAENMEIRLQNGALVAFRSLEDPERARGPHGVGWGWFDEAAQSPERAYDVFEPTLIAAGGIVFATTTVLGFDWTYDKIEKRAFLSKDPGYWAIKYWTEENPLFKTNPVMMRQIERARETQHPDFFDQEYRAERRNAAGLIFDYKKIEKLTLKTDADVRRLIPEWPNIDTSRTVLIGLDSGTDHPFGALLVVVTEQGLVVVSEYLERQKALSTHLPSIQAAFRTARFNPMNVKWAANKNEANLRLEFGLRGVGVIPAESKQEVGIQRLQSWLHTERLYFAYTCPRTIEQMGAYKYAENYGMDGQKRDKEKVFKKNDELPDALRYVVMSWPSLPQPRALANPREESRMAAFDAKTLYDLDRMREFNKRSEKMDLEPDDDGYPLGDFFNGDSRLSSSSSSSQSPFGW